MSTSFSGEKLAVLLASGFNETDLTSLQKALMPSRIPMRIVSMDRGLVNSWNETDWGLSFAADKALNEALAADFDMLLIPGGQRSIDKLKLTAHTKRFIGGFMDAGKPVVAMGDAIDLLAFTDKIASRRVNGPETMKDMVEQAGGVWSEDVPCMDENLMTGSVLQNPRFAEDVVRFLQSSYDGTEQAAA